MTRINSFTFTGLLSCTQFWSAISRRVSVEMSPVRMMTGELGMTFLPQLFGDLKPIQAIREIEVGQDEIGPDRRALQHCLRGNAVGRRCHMMAFVLEKKFEELA